MDLEFDKQTSTEGSMLFYVIGRYLYFQDIRFLIKQDNLDKICLVKYSEPFSDADIFK